METCEQKVRRQEKEIDTAKFRCEEERFHKSLPRGGATKIPS